MSIAMSRMSPSFGAVDLGVVTDLAMQKSQIVVAHLIERPPTVPPLTRASNAVAFFGIACNDVVVNEFTEGFGQLVGGTP